MRTRTSTADEYGWYTAAMRGERPPVHEDEPQSGWYKMRRVKGGQWVPVRIWWWRQVDHTGDLVEPEKLRCVIGGIYDEFDADPAKLWVSCAKRPISPTEYNKLYTAAAREPLDEKPARP